MKDNVGELFFKKKQVKLLLALLDKKQNWYLSNLAKAADTTYVHTTKFVTKCEEHGLISAVKHGKVKNLFITEKGIEVANNISNVLNKLVIKPVEKETKKE